MNINIDELNNALIICPNNYKQKILESFSNESKIVNANFMSLSEYKKNYLFDYGVDAVRYLVKKGLSPDNAKEILENIYYIENKDYKNSKLNTLVQYKKELEENGLLIYNNIFRSYLQNKNVVVIGYGKLNDFDSNLIVGKTVNTISEEYIDKIYDICTFKEIEEEVEYIYNSIYNLLEKEIDINNIYIVNANNDYISCFKRYNTYYGFNVEYDNKQSLIATRISKEFIEYTDNKTKQELFDYLSRVDSNESKALINILNRYVDYELKDVKDLVLNDIQNTTITKRYNNVVKCVDIMTPFDSNDHVFLIGFNDSISNGKRDVDYINDSIKHYVHLQTTEQINELNKINLLNHISNIDNLYLSYSQSSPFNTYNKQVLLPEDKCKYTDIKGSFEYSEKLNKYKYSKKLDNIRKFNSNELNIDKLYLTYGKNNYLKYNNRFKGLDNEQINNLINQINSFSDRKDKNKLNLSYSTLNDFCECSYKYYLKSVLNVKEQFGTYYTKVGTVCHEVLKDLYNDKSFDFESSWNKHVHEEEQKENTKIFDNENEKYFVEKLKEELKQDIEIVKKQKQNSLLNDEICEKYFESSINDKINYIGFADKVMYRQTPDNTFVSVVDYKTSKSIDIDKEIMKYGLSLQLPSYLYLIKHSKLFSNDIKMVGLYIQHLINYDRKYEDENSSLLNNKEESLKLDGITSSKEDRVQALDITLQPSSKSGTIKGVSMNKDGSLKKSNKLYDDEQFDELCNIVEKNVKKAGQSIIEGSFAINPKQIDGVNKSCKYCEYAPICYKKASDLIVLSTKEEQ